MYIKNKFKQQNILSFRAQKYICMINNFISEYFNLSIIEIVVYASIQAFWVDSQLT